MSALTYRPALTVRLDGGIEQTFDANVVHVDDEVAAFGELVPDPDRGLPYGTVVHSLLVHLGEQGAEQIEFNDQGNSVPIPAVECVELARNELRVVFRPAQGVFAGRVRLPAGEEVFEDATPEHEAGSPFSNYASFGAIKLAALRVRFDVDDAQLQRLRAKLSTPAC